MAGVNRNTRDTRSKSTASSEIDPPAWAVSLQEESVQKMKTLFMNELVKVTEKIDADIKNTLEPIIKENKVLKKVTTKLSQDVSLQKHQIDHLKSKCATLSSRLTRLESYSMRENLTFTGIEESEGESEETLCNTLYELFSEDMEIDTSSLVIVTCHRLSRMASYSRQNSISCM